MCVVFGYVLRDTYVFSGRCRILIRLHLHTTLRSKVIFQLLEETRQRGPDFIHHSVHQAVLRHAESLCGLPTEVFGGLLLQLPGVHQLQFIVEQPHRVDHLFTRGPVKRLWEVIIFQMVNVEGIGDKSVYVF